MARSPQKPITSPLAYFGALWRDVEMDGEATFNGRPSRDGPIEPLWAADDRRLQLFIVRPGAFRWESWVEQAGQRWERRSGDVSVVGDRERRGQDVAVLRRLLGWLRGSS